MARAAPDATLQFRLRVMHRGEIALGPGKIDLLRAIQDQGSIAKAAKRLGMSYMRAWTLIKVMNQSFRAPLVQVERGGATGGSASLTPLGQEALRLYSEIIQKSEKASAPSWTKLKKHLSK